MKTSVKPADMGTNSKKQSRRQSKKVKRDEFGKDQYGDGTYENLSEFDDAPEIKVVPEAKKPAGIPEPKKSEYAGVGDRK